MFLFKKMPWKLILAVAFVTSGFAAGFVWATPGAGISTTIVSGPVTLDAARALSQSEDHGVLFMTRGESDVYVVQNVIKPGGHTGWHSHPGPSVVSVVSGTATEYRSDSDEAIVFEAGTAFVDEGGDHAHIIVNRGNVDLVLVAFQVLPQGAPRRIDVPAP